MTTGGKQQNEGKEYKKCSFHAFLFDLRDKDSQNIKKSRLKMYIFEIIYLFLYPINIQLPKI
jgi:hypothetical protein